MREFLKSLSIRDKENIVPWNGYIGIIYSFFMFIATQIFGAFVLMLVPLSEGHSWKQSADWLNSTISHQFYYVVLVELLTIFSILGFMRLWRAKLKLIGLRKIKLTDVLWGIAAYLVYLVIYLIVITTLTKIFPALNANTKQEVGFNNPNGNLETIMTFISLVLLPPIAEEIMVRGFMYSSFKKISPKWLAIILTSLLFGAAHLPEGVGGLLWVGFIDTFLLSVVLIYLREKTDGLYASMVSHFLKNGTAFFALYIAGNITGYIR
jgi:hypothetical protein